jgi:hypothetical protein
VGATTTFRPHCYDANGNLIRGWNFTANRQRNLTYKSYDQVATVDDPRAAETRVLSFHRKDGRDELARGFLALIGFTLTPAYCIRSRATF